jgi:hypothetical protein
MKTAAFPVIKTLDELDRSACSVPGPAPGYLASLEWITARENLCLAGPGTGKSHVLVALGAAAVRAGHKVRYFTAADLAETLYRGLADNSVGKVIENLLRNDLILIDEVGFAPLDDTGAQLLFRIVSAAGGSCPADVAGPGVAWPAGRDAADRPPRRDAADRHSGHHLAPDRLFGKRCRHLEFQPASSDARSERSCCA